MSDTPKFLLNHQTGRMERSPHGNWMTVADHERALAEAERRLAQRAVPCEWKEDSEGQWETACGQLFYFNEGGVEENNFHFCHGCGHPVNATKYVDPPIDDDEPLPAAPGEGEK